MCWSCPFMGVDVYLSLDVVHSICSNMTIIEGSLEVKLPTIWTDEKQRWEESERREEYKREDRRRKRVRRKKMQMQEKVGKSRNTVFFQWFVAPEGRKVGSLKRRVRSHLAKWEMTNCTPLWREAHFELKMYKTFQLRTTFGSWDVEKVHPVVARSTFRSQNAQNTSATDHFWKLRCRKSERRCGAKHISKSTSIKHISVGPLLEVTMSKKCAPLWREADFEVKMLKTPGVRTSFGRSDVVSRGRRKGLCTFWKVSKTWGFCSMSKNDGRRGTFEEDLQRCISRGRHSTKNMFIRDVRRSGRWIPERGCILEHQICRFAKMILRDRCSTSYDLASIFRARRNTLDRWSGKIAKRIGTRPSALHSTFHFWRKSRRIVSFLTLSTPKIKEVSQTCFVIAVVKFEKMKTSRRIASFLTLSSSKIEEVSQNCFVFDVGNFEKWRSLAELLCFWRCQVQNLRTSRRTASLLMLSSLKWRSLAELLRFWRVKFKNWGVSQNCFAFDVGNFEKWRSLAELLCFWRCQVQNLRTSRRIAAFWNLQIGR